MKTREANETTGLERGARPGAICHDDDMFGTGTVGAPSAGFSLTLRRAISASLPPLAIGW